MLGESAADLVDVLLVAGFHRDAKYTRVDIDEGIGALMKHARDIGAEAGDELADEVELARTVGNLKREGAETATLLQATGDDAVEHGDVNITAADYTDRLFAFEG